MRTLPGASCLIVCAVVAAATPVRAAFHFWDIKEIFSSADGSVQFIEFVCNAATGEHFLSGHNLTATSDGVPVSYTFTGNLNTLQSTANRHFLAATDGFASLTGGIAANYTIPANFFNPNANSITLNFAFGTDSVTFAGALLPKDGVNSLTDQNPAGATNLVAGLNSPTNFAGAAGSVNVPPPTFLPGDFDENRTVAAADLNVNWRAGFGKEGPAVVHQDGDADADDDVDGGDFLVWQQQLGMTSSAQAIGAVPEPAAGLLAALAAGAIGALRRVLPGFTASPPPRES